MLSNDPQIKCTQAGEAAVSTYLVSLAHAKRSASRLRIGSIDIRDQYQLTKREDIVSIRRENEFKILEVLSYRRGS